MITFLFCIFNLFLSVSSFLRKRGEKTISWPFFVQPNFNNGSTHITAFTMVTAAAAAAKSPQSCRTLCDPIDSSPPGSAVHGILQARTLEWVAISFSNVWKWKVKVKSFSRVRLVATPWTAAYQAPLSMRFSRQEYWSGLPLPSLTIVTNYFLFPSTAGAFQFLSCLPHAFPSLTCEALGCWTLFPWTLLLH